MDSQVPPITSSGRLGTHAEVIYHVRKPEARQIIRKNNIHELVCCLNVITNTFIASLVSSGCDPASHGSAGTSDHTYIPNVLSSGGDPAAHGFAGSSDHASLPSVVSSGVDPAAHVLAGTSDQVYWAGRDPGSSDLAAPTPTASRQ